jgi:hypothetical protein
MARDVLERRQHVPTVPRDTNDPPRFGQLVELTKDAFVEALRAFFQTSPYAERHQEVPTIEKYAVGFGAGLDPYQTFVQIVERHPDIKERLPHIAVTAAQGTNARMTAGRPLVAHTQLPPRVVTTVAGPYALANPTSQISEVSVLNTLGGAYTVTLDGVPSSATVMAGTSVPEIAAAVALALRTSPAGVGLLYEITATTGASAIVRIRRRDPGVAFAISTSANLAATTPTAASLDTAPSSLVFETMPGLRAAAAETSTITYPPSRFASSEPLSAVPAAALARVTNEQGLYVTARTLAVGVGTGVQFEVGGKTRARMPNSIEVLSSSTPALVTALGLGNLGTAGAGASISGVPPDMTVTLPSATLTTAMIGRNLTLAGATTAANDGRFPITARPTPTSVVITNAEGVAEALPSAASWFIGFRDDSQNAARPVMNRFHMGASLTLTVDVLAESENERRELVDLVWSKFLFFDEEQHFTLYGRGVFDEAYPDEHYQISIHQEVQDGGEQEFPRGEDQKNPIHAGRISLPATTYDYLDRPVLVTTGPAAGQSYTLESENITADDNLPSSS